MKKEVKSLYLPSSEEMEVPFSGEVRVSLSVLVLVSPVVLEARGGFCGARRFVLSSVGAEGFLAGGKEEVFLCEGGLITGVHHLQTAVIILWWKFVPALS
ncbi:UNVERIFIED_CONTAM: hypothetical protein K2H54_021914 [Gekko kuhli]